MLTPPYETAYRERWRQQQELGEVQYDRLTHCEPPGYPRWLLEPYSHEFINLPHESYLINDYGPAIRRVYIGQEHKNVYGTHSWYGDTIGFWDGDKLVTHTKYLLPADFTRWSPMTSNQFESVETWELKQYPGDIERLEVQVTFYDRHAFVKPVSAVYAFRRGEGARSGRPSRPALGVRDEQQRRLRQRHDDVEAAGRGGVQGRAGNHALPGSARPVARSDLQHHASEREGAGNEDDVPFAAGRPCRIAADGVGRHGPPFVRDVRPERRESRDRHGRCAGRSMPRIRGSI